MVRNALREGFPDEQAAIDAPLRAFPSKLFVETTTRCNLNCAMCVKQARDSEICEGDFSPELFARLDCAFPQLEALVLNGVGEPLLNRHLEQFIRKARKSMPPSGWIGFQSNGLLMSQLRAASLIEAGVDKVCISIDAISPEQLKTMREGAEVDKIDGALAALDQAKKLCHRPEVEIGIEFVSMRKNIGGLPETLAWAAGRGASFAIVTHVLPYHELHADQAVFCNVSDQALALYRSWHRKAAKIGIDLERYFEVVFKYGRTRKEQALVAMVEAMKADAARREIVLDLKKLFQVEQPRIDEVSEIFDAARSVADRTGLDLRLPEVALKQQRKCNFIEEGSAFVSWSGEISPCYFLWHRYDCFANGWNQKVRTKTFGNVADRDLLQIWNGAQFKSFREGALAYDYSFCASCSVAPCDYVQTEEFEQDCHIRDVQCGSCLWNTGIFQCLR